MDVDPDPYPLPVLIAQQQQEQERRRREQQQQQQEATVAPTSGGNAAASPHDVKLCEALAALVPIIAADQVPTCPAAQIPSAERLLSEHERREALSAVIAATMNFNPYRGNRQRCTDTPPVVLRAQVIQRCSDIQVLASLVAMLMYDERSYETLLCNSVNPRVVDSSVLECFITKMWNGNFHLRLDNDFLYFFDASENRFAIMMSNLNSHITLELLRELVRRYHLWRGALSSDQTYAKMDGFVYNPEFRAMLDRSVLMSRFVAYYLHNQCTSKRMEELCKHTLTVQRLANLNQLQCPLSEREREALDAIVALLSSDVVDSSKLSAFTHPNDTNDVPEVISKTFEQLY